MSASVVFPFIALVIVIVIMLIAYRSFILVRQAQTALIERLGRYHRTLTPGLHFVAPIVDKVAARIDMREQVVVFQPQSVITKDNLVVSIDSVVYFQVGDPKRSTYEIQNYLNAIEQLSVTTLRNVIGTLDLEQTLSGTATINAALRTAMDETTGAWGVRVSRVELRSITPPANVAQAMEAQMRAEREKRAAILTAEGQQQSAIKVAEGEKQSAVLRAEGDRQSAILRADGEAKAVEHVALAVRKAGVDDVFLSYQQIQQWGNIAYAPSNKIWILPQELSGAAGALTRVFNDKKNSAEENGS